VLILLSSNSNSSNISAGNCADKDLESLARNGCKISITYNLAAIASIQAIFCFYHILWIYWLIG
jgi:hypothetical protein